MDLKRGTGDFNRNINSRAIGVSPYIFSYRDTVFGRLVFLTNPPKLTELVSQKKKEQQ